MPNRKKFFITSRTGNVTIYKKQYCATSWFSFCVNIIRLQGNCIIYNLQMPNRHKLLVNFKNTTEKLLKTNAAIWFNKICKNRQLTPT